MPGRLAWPWRGRWKPAQRSGALVSLIWLRQNRWDVFDRRPDSRQQAERHARSHAKSLAE
jgi:hypothetical protein